MRNGKEIFLSALEYRLLLVFFSHRGMVLTRTMLLEEIWDVAGEYVNDNTLTTLIPLEAIALPDEIHETIPAGTNLYFLRTDCLSYVDMQAEDGQEWRSYLDTSQWPITVNGISIDQCFDGIFYLG